MRRFRVFGGCVLATFAITAVASSVAAANSPVFYTKAAIGTVAGSVPFTGKLGAAFLEGSISKSKITCVGGTAAGEVTGATVTKENNTTFTGCETSGLKCQSAGQASGTIRTVTLEGVLGAITATLPGIRLFSQSEGRGGTLAEFECGGGLVNVVVTGSVIGSFSGASGLTVEEGKLPASGKLTFAEAKGIQKYTHFEGEGAEQLSTTINGGTPEQSGQSVIATLESTPKGNLGGTK